MERLSNTKSSGLNRNGLRTWGLIFLAAGIFGRSVLQNQVLGIGQVNTQQLLEVMNSNMMIATLALVLQVIETCAAPIFALLLVEGFQNTANYKNYLLRVLGVAALSELPYNLAMGGGLLDLSSRNPVFSMVLGLIVLYFYQRYSEKGMKNVLIKLVVTLAAMGWAFMLQITEGICLILLTGILWAFRKKPLYRNFVGATAVVVCSLLSPFYLAAPMGFLVIHLYNGEKGEDSRVVSYLAYPAVLLVIGIAAQFI